MSPLAIQIDSLPVDEKYQLIRELMDSIATDEAKIPVSDEDKAEVMRRLELFRRGELTTDSWDNVRAKILSTPR